MNIKRSVVAILMAGVTLSINTFAEEAGPKTDHEKLSYGIGADLGANFKKQAIPIDLKMMTMGMQDALSGKSLKLSPQEITETVDRFKRELMAKRIADLNKQSTANLTAGEAFLKDNKSKQDVVELPSGLQYKVLQKGEGIKPGKNDEVTVDYEGRLLNGKVFDSSYSKGKPVSFVLSSVIPGWIEGLQLMPEGSTWELYIPAKLAYGTRSMGPIGPNETLIFKVHLVSVKKVDQQTAHKSS